MRRGILRVYLGAAPGVGKTYDMLSEGRRRHERGTDVVVGFVETHGRIHTAELLDGMEIVPRRTLTYRGAEFTEMDFDAVLARAPKVATSGAAPCATPEEADVEVMVSPTLALAMRGRVLPADDRRVLEAFAAQAAVVLDRERLRQQASEARQLEQGDTIRTALLAAVSHDLRTPLASIRAAVGSLRQTDVKWSAEDEAELLATVDIATTRLERLIDNLLDLSRLQAGAVRPLTRPVSLDEIVPRAVEGVPPERIRIDVPEALPLVNTDPGLLERVIANVIENALRYGRPETPVVVSASDFGHTVELSVVDRGPGVPDDFKARMFESFQRLGDSPAGEGVGLGLAVARGFVEAVGGTLLADDTPGGGLTMVVSLPTADLSVSPERPVSAPSDVAAGPRSSL